MSCITVKLSSSNPAAVDYIVNVTCSTPTGDVTTNLASVSHGSAAGSVYTTCIGPTGFCTATAAVATDATAAITDLDMGNGGPSLCSNSAPSSARKLAIIAGGLRQVGSVKEPVVGLLD